MEKEGKGFVISGQVNLRMLCEFISSIICPDVEGFFYIFTRSTSIEEIKGLLTQQFKHHCKLEYETSYQR